jgi:hypothetical protein
MRSMRWERLFADLEAQLLAAHAAELAGETSERTRRELALVRTPDRLAGSRGHPVAVSVHGPGVLRGVLRDAGVDWLLLEEPGAREILVPLHAVLSVTGLGAATAVPGSEGRVGRRLDLRWALRGLARSRAAVALGLRDGSTLSGTLDRVGADHVELAEHGPGETRRAGAVREVRLVPLGALSAVRSGG